MLPAKIRSINNRVGCPVSDKEFRDLRLWGLGSVDFVNLHGRVRPVEASCQARCSTCSRTSTSSSSGSSSSSSSCRRSSSSSNSSSYSSRRSSSAVVVERVVPSGGGAAAAAALQR